MRLIIKEHEATTGSIPSPAVTWRTSPTSRSRTTGATSESVFQDYKLLPNRTVHDNVAYALQVTGGGRKEIRAKVPDILALTGLSTKLHNFPTSSPARAAAGLGRARVVNHPPLLLADEPPATSTPRHRSDQCSCSTGSTAPARTVVVATHDNAMVDRNAPARHRACRWPRRA